MAIRDHLVLFLNGNRHEVHGSDCFLSLSDFLRYRLGLTGTKIVCSEGDCGSCTVLVGRPEDKAFKYRPIDSCIRLMFQLDGVHVVTVEGLRGAGGDQAAPDGLYRGSASHGRVPRFAVRILHARVCDGHARRVRKLQRPCTDRRRMAA